MSGMDDNKKARNALPDDSDQRIERDGPTVQRPERPSRHRDKEGDRLPDRDRIIHYRVNGERQRTEEKTLTVEEILRRAGAPAGIDTSSIGSYYLESLRDSHKFKDLADAVTIEDGDQFLAVYSGRTPVA